MAVVQGDRSTLESGLRNGLTQLSLSLDDVKVNALLDYLALVGKWTQVYNLTAVRDPQDMFCLLYTSPSPRDS